MSCEPVAVVVWCADDGLHSQAFQASDDAEVFARSAGAWAVVIIGDQHEFAGSLSVAGEWPFPAFGGEV